MSAPPFELSTAHRWFAIECNNHAWDLVETTNRTQGQLADMLHAAHAARFHWQRAGNALNAFRAETLLSIAYSTAGRGEPALYHARETLSLMTTIDDLTPFDRTTAEAAAARACELAGKANQAKVHWASADDALAQCADAEDRDALRKLFPELQ